MKFNNCDRKPNTLLIIFCSSCGTGRLKRRKIHAEVAKCIAAVCEVKSTHAVLSDAVLGFSGPDESLLVAKGDNDYVVSRTGWVSVIFHCLMITWHLQCVIIVMKQILCASLIAVKLKSKLCA